MMLGYLLKIQDGCHDNAFAILNRDFIIIWSLSGAKGIDRISVWLYCVNKDLY